MRFLKQFLAVAVVAFAGGQAVAAVKGNPWLTLAVGAATVVLAILTYAWVVRRTERRAVTEVARSGAGAAIGRGVALGLAMCGAVVLNIAFLGGYHVEGFGSLSGAIGLLGFMAVAAVTEELIFRAFFFGSWRSVPAHGSR